jgi:CheY-like chemotaxis protein
MDYKGKLLIVDDEKITLENLEHIMKKEGYKVKGTNSGSSALKLLEDHMFDLVLTDLRMDKIDGMQVLSKCKELYQIQR